MYLTKHLTADGPRWALNNRFLPPSFSVDLLLQLPKAATSDFLRTIPVAEPASGKLLAPLEPMHEVWAAGVTYLRSREAREAESTVKDVYSRVYDAKRPELFFKAIGWRVVGHQAPIRIRDDSQWNVPEPELTLVINSHREILGFCAGNDVSSRDIEGENPLYLPQAKVYNGSCALGPGILLSEVDRLRDLPIQVTVTRAGIELFQGETRTGKMKRSFEDLVDHLGKGLDLPRGAFLMTGTGIVPPQEFSMERGDLVRITVGSLTLENEVAALAGGGATSAAHH
jgi:2-dehydro-3-deoxy-D-arabinonate dehydratase